MQVSSNKCWHEHIENKGNTVSFENDVEKDDGERSNLDNLYLERNANYIIYSSMVILSNTSRNIWKTLETRVSDSA